MSDSTPDKKGVRSAGTGSIFNWLSSHFVVFSRMLSAVKEKDSPDLDSVMQFLRLHPDVINTVDKYKNSFLHYVVLAGREDIVKELVGMKADLNLVNDAGQAPIHDAIAKGDVGIVTLLLETGKAQLPETCLHVAAEQGYQDLVELLIDKYGARRFIDSLDQNRWRPLDFAAHNGHFEVAQKLVESGATVDEAAVQFARMGRGDPKVIAYLLKAQQEQQAGMDLQQGLEFKKR